MVRLGIGLCAARNFPKNLVEYNILGYCYLKTVLRTLCIDRHFLGSARQIYALPTGLPSGSEGADRVTFPDRAEPCRLFVSSECSRLNRPPSRSMCKTHLYPPRVGQKIGSGR